LTEDPVIEKISDRAPFDRIPCVQEGPFDQKHRRFFYLWILRPNTICLNDQFDRKILSPTQLPRASLPGTTVDQTPFDRTLYDRCTERKKIRDLNRTRMNESLTKQFGTRSFNQVIKPESPYDREMSFDRKKFGLKSYLTFKIDQRVQKTVYTAGLFSKITVLVHFTEK
jgi:hypothetical protein